ncbi:MAG TPA: tRNA lysidine(34) synthetase TilS [bacterium]|nr:tRNA lysidine(34) synthetase TilS [bacterium]
MITPGERVLVALSGGPDSMALLSLLKDMQKELGISLSAAHLNHRLRGKASDRDETFVRRTARKLKIPCETSSSDVERIAREQKKTIEEAARDERYAFLLSAARKTKASKIAVAHTADDQVETILFRMIRGATGGMAGIPPTRALDTGITVIRPLINVWKKEILHYLKENKIAYRIDRSNGDTAFIRNKIRHRLLPYLLKGFNPNIKEVLMNNARNLSEIGDLARWETQKVFKGLVRRHGNGRLELDRNQFEILHPAVRKEVVRECLRMLKGNLSVIYFNNIANVLSVALVKQSGKLIALPGGINVRREFDKIVFALEPKQPLARHQHSLAVPGTTLMEDLSIRVDTEVFPRNELDETAVRKQRAAIPFPSEMPAGPEYFDLDTLKLPLAIRTRRAGDRYRPIGMAGTKKVKEILIEGKIPVSRRDRVPLIVDADGKIVWLIGYRIGEKYKIKSSTKRCLRMQLSLNNSSLRHITH